MEAVVDIRIIDQTFPPHSRSGLLEVGAHDNEEVVRVAFFEFQETVGIIEGSGRVMDGARADDNKEAALWV